MLNILNKYIIVLLFIPIWSYSQKGNNTIYKKDFKEFKQIIKKINPQLFIRKKVTGYSAIDNIDKYDNQIDTCSSFSSFANIINNCLLANIDSHIYLADSNIVKSLTQKEIDYRKLDYSKMLKSSRLLKLEKNQNNSLSYLPVKYINGKYYLITNIVVKDKKYHSGTEITKCNGEDINIFINRNIHSFYNPVQWDYIHQHYFNEYFTFIKYPEIKQIKIESEVVDMSQPIKFQINRFRQASIVKLIDSILYIKIPKMEKTQFFITEVLKYKNEDLQGIVFDVRGNMGGSDAVWKEILSYIIPENLKFNENIYFRNTRLLKNEFGIKGPILKNRLLPKKYYIDFTTKSIIRKNENSINFKGNIIVIQDREIFSATANFIETIKQYKETKIIGQVSGWLLGYQTMPRVFSLKNTGISFVMPISIDLKDIRNIENVYHNKVDIEIETNINYYRNLYSNKNTEEIIDNDIFIKKAVQILNKVN